MNSFAPLKLTRSVPAILTSCLLTVATLGCDDTGSDPAAVADYRQMQRIMLGRVLPDEAAGD